MQVVADNIAAYRVSLDKLEDKIRLINTAVKARFSWMKRNLCSYAEKRAHPCFENISAIRVEVM